MPNARLPHSFFPRLRLEHMLQQLGLLRVADVVVMAFFLCAPLLQRPNVGGVSIRSRNGGAPSGKG